MPHSNKHNVVIHSEFPWASCIVPPKALFPQKSSIWCYLNLVKTEVLWSWPYLTPHCNFQIVDHGFDNDGILFYLIRWMPAIAKKRAYSDTCKNSPSSIAHKSNVSSLTEPSTQLSWQNMIHMRTRPLTNKFPMVLMFEQHLGKKIDLTEYEKVLPPSKACRWQCSTVTVQTRTISQWVLSSSTTESIILHYWRALKIQQVQRFWISGTCAHKHVRKAHMNVRNGHKHSWHALKKYKHLNGSRACIWP
jgi:hypothetical protein